MYGGKTNAYRFLVGKAQGSRPFGRPKCRWEENIKMYLKGIGWQDVEWIDLALDKDK
jgi:hypothetical protein